MNNVVFAKIMENVRKHNRGKKELFDIGAKLPYAKTFLRYFIRHRSKKKNFMNELVYLDLSMLEISKIVIYEFWYNYLKPRYCEKAKLCYMDRDSFIVDIKTVDINVCIEKHVETRFDTSNYELKRPLSKGKCKKVIGLMKNELRGKSIRVLHIETNNI